MDSTKEAGVSSDSRMDKFTVVIKIGTSSLILPQFGSLNLSGIARLCETVRELRQQGHAVVLVTSGAVGAGCQRLNVKPPTTLADKQALAAVGQVQLMALYRDLFAALGETCAQVLLTLDNLAHRSQYLNARSTFSGLLRMGVVPIVNENDSVGVEQLRIGDNDTLAAQVAALVEADWLFLLTDVDALYTANPKSDPTAVPIREVPDLSTLEADTTGSGTSWGTGGMVTKLTAARLATAAGCNMAIILSQQLATILPIMGGARDNGTVFLGAQRPVKGRKRWILSVPIKGALRLDDGAVRAVCAERKSLFSVGVVAVEGDFAAQDAVRLMDPAGREVGRGLCNYSAQEMKQLIRCPSTKFEAILGYSGPEEVCHRGRISVMLGGAASQDQLNLQSEDVS